MDMKNIGYCIVNDEFGVLGCLNPKDGEFTPLVFNTPRRTTRVGQILANRTGKAHTVALYDKVNDAVIGSSGMRLEPRTDPRETPEGRQKRLEQRRIERNKARLEREAAKERARRAEAERAAPPPKPDL